MKFQKGSKYGRNDGALSSHYTLALGGGPDHCGVACCSWLYFLFSGRSNALIEDEKKFANLAARIAILQAEEKSIRQWIQDQNVELERLSVEREEQERLQALLAELEQKYANKAEDVQSLRKEAGELENQRHALSNTLENIRIDIENGKKERGELESKRVETEAVETRLAEMKLKLEDAREAIKGLADAEVRLIALTAEKTSLKMALEDLQKTAEKQKAEAIEYQNNAEKRRAESEQARIELEGLRNEKAQLDISVATLREMHNNISKDISHLEEQTEVLKQSAKSFQEASKGYSEQAQKTREEKERITRDAAHAGVRLIALTAEKANLEGTLEDLQKTAEKQKAEAIEYQINAEKRSAESEQARIEVEGLRNEKAQLDISVATLREMHQTHLRDIKNLQRQIEAIEEATKAAQIISKKHEAEAEKIGAEKKAAENLIDKVHKEKAEAGVILDTLRHEQDAIGRDISRKEKKVDELKNTLQTAMEETQKNTEISNQARKDVEKTQNTLDEVHKKKQRIDLELGELNAAKAVIKREIDDLENQGKASGEGKSLQVGAYDDLLKTIPPCLSEKKFSPEATTLDERALLDELKDSLDSNGLKFSDRIIYSFHTSLKCHSINPLTVLAGVSGTGKTLLPMKYAQIMGMHSLVISVQPRWDSPQDMFGFYNYLEKKYKATDLARSLIRMDQVHDFEGLSGIESSDRMLLVLMDEMNLARTEYYFSEFLSKLELRKQGDREKAEIVLETGPGSKRQFRVWVGDNILFVGTMNEDETTQTLSDKVLDRANVLRFGKPTGKVEGEKPSEEDDNTSFLRHHLTLKRWLDWIKPYSSEESWVPEVESWTDEINNILNGMGRPFGYRVQKTIKKYIANYPGINEGNNGYKFAFADQVEQKIIPKLRGLDLMDHGGALQEIYQVIEKLDDGPLTEAFGRAKDDSTVGMFVWRGVSRSVEN